MTHQKTTTSNQESESYTYDEDGNQTYEIRGQTYTRDKYGNLIREYCPAKEGFDDTWGFEYKYPETETLYDYKLMYSRWRALGI